MLAVFAGFDSLDVAQYDAIIRGGQMINAPLQILFFGQDVV